MTWAKIDTSFFASSRIIEAGWPARELYLLLLLRNRAGRYDGVVPTREISPRVCDAMLAMSEQARSESLEKLEASGLVRLMSENVHILGWDASWRTPFDAAERKRRQRANEAERKKRQRAKIKREKDGCHEMSRTVPGHGHEMSRTVPGHGHGNVPPVPPVENRDRDRDREAAPSGAPPSGGVRAVFAPDLILSPQSNPTQPRSTRALSDCFPGAASLSATKRRVLARHAESVTQIWALMNTLRKETIPGARTLTPVAESAVRLSERLEAGATLEDCEHVLRVVAAECGRDRASQRWFQPATLWRPDNFARKLGQTCTPGDGGRPDPRVGQGRPMTYDECPPSGRAPMK